MVITDHSGGSNGSEPPAGGAAPCAGACAKAVADKSATRAKTKDFILKDRVVKE